MDRCGLALVTVCVMMMAVRVQGECEYNGQLYTTGQTYPVDCNTCTCNADGSSSCTEIGCTVPDCTYAGRPRSAGDSFPSEDGCNDCSCSEGGAVACTERACVHPCEVDNSCKPCPQKNGNTIEHGGWGKDEEDCNTCSCSDGSLACTLMACVGPHRSSAESVSVSGAMFSLLIAALVMVARV